MPKKFITFGMVLLFLAGCGVSGRAAYAVPEAINMIKTAPEEVPYTTAATDCSSQRTKTSAQTEGITDPAREKAAEKSAPQYFIFSRESGSQENDDGNVLLAENRCDMRFFSGDPIREQWVNGILSENHRRFDTTSENLVAYAEDVIAEYGSDSFYTYTNYQDQGISRHDSRVVSAITITRIHFGGAHPKTDQTAMNLDMKEQRLLKLEDVIYEDGASELERMVQTAVKNKFEGLGVDALYEDYADIIAASMSYGRMTPSWYFGDDSLVVFYNQYELGPYAAGIIKVEVAYENLGGILREAFFPQASEECRECDLTIAADAQNLEQIPCIIEPNGPEILIRANGTVRDVQVSEVFWVDETPVSQVMMISISELNEENVLVLTGGFDDENRSFAVEFSDECGKRQMYYIHPEGLSEEP